MANPQVQVYEVNALGPDGELMAQGYLPYPLPEEFDGTLIDRQDAREVHFQTLQRALGASDYEAHLMLPREVRKLERKIRREEALDELTRKAARLIGFANLVELLPVMEELQQPGSQPLREGLV